MNKLSLCQQSSAAEQLADKITLKISHLRALLLIGSDVDFSDYPASISQDFLGAVLECVDEVDNLWLQFDSKKS